MRNFSVIVKEIRKNNFDKIMPTDLSNEIAELKGAALDRRIRERGVRKASFVRHLGYESTEALRMWRRGKHWPQELEGKMEALLALSPGFFQRIGAGDDYEALVKIPFASSRLAPLALRAVGDVVSEPRVYEQVQQGGENDMAEGGNRHEAEELVFPPNTTKRKDPSRVPMAPRTVEIIRRLEGAKASEYVFTAVKGGPIRQRWFHRQVTKAMKQTGIQGLWVHDLRGTFITRMVIDRKHDRTLVKLATDHLTDYAFDRYVRPTREHVREMLRGRGAQDQRSEGG